MLDKRPIRKVGGAESFLMMGADRELFLTSAGLTLFLIIYIQMWSAAFVGILFWLFVVWGLRLMGKADPQMRQKYMRNRRYKSYYPAKATHFYTNKINY
jgi:type IV secretion system protein TrbD